MPGVFRRTMEKPVRLETVSEGESKETQSWVWVDRRREGGGEDLAFFRKPWGV